MNKSVLIGILLILIVVAGGWWLWSRTQTASLPQPTKEETITPDTAAGAAPALTGTWQSTDDSRFIREFRAQGEVVDTYTGMDDATTIGTWALVPESGYASLPVPATDYPVVQLTFAEEALFFGIAEVTADSLVLINYSGNGVLTFERVTSSR